MKLGIALIISSLISLLFGILAGHYAAVASSGFAKNLRQKLYYAVQDFSFANIDQFSTSSLVTRMTTDVTNIQNAYQMIIRVAFRAPFMLIFSLIMTFSISPKLSLVFLAIIPFLGTGLYLVISKAHPIFERVFKTYDKLNKVVQENLRGIRVVKSFVREDHEKGKFHTVSKKIFNDFSTAEKILAYNGPMMQFSVYTAILLIS
jgi:ATP-binding cassette subfamily B protein